MPKPFRKRVPWNGPQSSRHRADGRDGHRHVIRHEHLLHHPALQPCEFPPEHRARVLRRTGLTGVKVGRGTGVCGSPSAVRNGKAVRSCAGKERKVAEYGRIVNPEAIETPGNRHPPRAAGMNRQMKSYSVKYPSPWRIPRIQLNESLSMAAATGSSPMVPE